MAGSLNVRWIHGSADCAANADPPLQVHQFDENTFILRQNKCLNGEGPFLYLLLGESRALLLDSGARPRPPRTLPVRRTVKKIIDAWLARRGMTSIALVVAHSHSHTDHLFGDGQFNQPGETVVAANLPAIQSFFGLTDWPNRTAAFDLGRRLISVIPTPGHEETHIALYDANTRILLSGDMLYAGLLVVRDWPAYRASAARLARFAQSHPIKLILGAHIEMKRTPREFYEPATEFQPDEHVLQLGPAHLQELHEACERIGDVPRRDIHNEFVIEPV
ncbi:MAG TPA: MBL fold metallo-hydrolase [Pyrinomonadaceae bacterium]|jgi:glyoxylase-like metal-dependent hydrolase (beta-lactamase superfamily II)